MDGKLFKFPFDGSQPTQQTLPGRVIGISVDKDAKLWVMVFEGLSNNAFILTPEKQSHDYYSVWYPKWKVSKKLVLLTADDKMHIDPEDIYGVAVGDNSVLVLTNRRVASLDKKSGLWHTVTLSKPIKEQGMNNPVALAQGDSRIWFGTDNGEWGGYLITADAKTGESREVWDTEPVTALASDPSGSDCVIFSTGLAHLTMEIGGLYKSCYGSKSVRLSKVNAPIWDLIASENGLYALSRGELIPIGKDALEEDKKIPLPTKLDKALSGLPAAVVSGVLVIYSAARWEVSTSGLTPYAVALPPEAKLKLQPWKPAKKGQEGCND
jgi:hypothetical protein